MSGVPSAEREWEKVDAKDVLACIQWQPRTYTVKVEENNKPISQVGSEFVCIKSSNCLMLNYRWGLEKNIEQV